MAVVLAAVAMASHVGVDGPQLATIMWVVALHLWFLPVYLVVVSLTPLAVAAQRRWWLKVPVALAAAVAVVDVITLGGHVPVLGAVNYALCWGAIYQVGVGWRGGAFHGRRPVLLATGAVVVLGTVIGQGLYPVSMIGVTGQTVQNTSPPTVALLALAGVQAGLLLTVAPAVSGWLRRPPGAHRLVIMNQNALARYLWHMAPVVVVALACYPTGWAPQPVLGSGTWWLCRLAWVGVLAVVTAAVLGLLWWGRDVFARAYPTVDIPLPRAWSQPLLVAGTAAAVCALWRFSAHGFRSRRAVSRDQCR